MRPYPLCLLVSVSFFAGSAASFAQASGFGSDAYILSHFHYADSSTVSVFQRNPLPSGEKMIPCGPKVAPASPGQETKVYHVDALVRPSDTSKIHSNDPSIRNDNRRPNKLPTQEKPLIGTDTNMCKLTNMNNSNINPKTGTRWCVMPRVGRYIVMSDVFHDSCGNYLRGVWETATVIDSYTHGNPKYTSSGEHSVTSSIGRMDGMDKDPEYSGVFHFRSGPTSLQNVSSFLFFVKASDEDMKQTNKVIQKQLQPTGKYLRCKDGTFAFEPEGCPG